MESAPTTEVSNLSTTGELTVVSAVRGSSPTLAMRRPNDESRPEISVRTLRSHSRGGRSSVCVQDPPSQAGSFPLCRESSMDRATRPNELSSEPEMLPDRPFLTSVGMNPSSLPLETISSDTPPSLVPTDISDEASASFHSTPDFHHTPQTSSSHIYLELPTTRISSELYTGPTPVTTHTPRPHFYTGSPHREFRIRSQQQQSQKHQTGPSQFYN